MSDERHSRVTFSCGFMGEFLLFLAFLMLFWGRGCDGLRYEVARNCSMVAAGFQQGMNDKTGGAEDAQSATE